MRKSVLFALFGAFLFVMIANVESTSMPNCETACKEPCKPVDCKCGTYRDICDCCDLCKKCKDEYCVRMAGEPCEDGYSCGDPDMDMMEIFTNTKIKCIPNPKA